MSCDCCHLCQYESSSVGCHRLSKTECTRLFGNNGVFTTSWEMVRGLHPMTAFALSEDEDSPLKVMKSLQLTNPAMFGMLDWIGQEYCKMSKSFVSHKAVCFLDELSARLYTKAIYEFVEVLSHKSVEHTESCFLNIVSRFWGMKRGKEFGRISLVCDEETGEYTKTAKYENGAISLHPIVTNALHTFWTPATGLDPSFIDHQCEMRLLSLNVKAAVLSIYEFSSLAAKKSTKIRNKNAYFMRILEQNKQVRPRPSPKSLVVAPAKKMSAKEPASTGDLYTTL